MFERNRRLSLPLSVPNSNGPKHDPDGPDDEKRRPKRTGWLTVHVPLPPGLPEAWRTSTRSTVSSSSSASKRRWQRAFVIPLPLPAAWRSRRGARILRACLVLGLLLLVVHYWTGSGVRTARTKGSSVVLAPDEIAKVWQWELFSGHHPGVTRVPPEIVLRGTTLNPVVPTSLLPLDLDAAAKLVGRGPVRRAITASVDADAGSHSQSPQRPSPGSIIDMDAVHAVCKSDVRACLEALRIGSLDTPWRVRRGGNRPLTYIEDTWDAPQQDWVPVHVERARAHARAARYGDIVPEFAQGPNLNLPTPEPILPSYRERAASGAVCDLLYPHMAHMLWTGGEEDADGLYLSLLSWVFTQNLGLDGPNAEVVRGECRPQLWVWVDDRGNKGMEEREEELVRRLVQSPWTAPFVTTRLAQSIRFQVWDTAKQLDAVPELADWRTIPALARLVTNKPKAPAAPGDANSEAEYNALTDVARLILPSRYGGAYVPPSTVFLRDWAELWNYRGQFGSSNRGILNTTPLLRLHRRSALSSFLLATGAAHGDFREEAIAKYLADARLEPLLFAAPGAMFDAGAQDAAFPVFRNSSDMFDADAPASLGAAETGFDAFFRGAYSYHMHERGVVDPARNYPDLGPRFAKRTAALREASEAAQAARGVNNGDLSWAAVLKRTFEAYLRGERTNMYGEGMMW